MKLNKNGFTLMELLIVVVIIVGFAAFTYPAYVSSIERARASEAVNMLATIQAVQSKHFVHYEEYGSKFKHINDFEPAIKDFRTNFADTDNFYTDYFHYVLSNPSADFPEVSAERVDSNHNPVNKGYRLTGRYKENFVRCYVLNNSDEGDKVCSSLTDKDKESDYYPIF